MFASIKKHLGSFSFSKNKLGLHSSIALLVILSMLIPNTGVFAAVPAAVSPTLNLFGFPNWYQDTTGTRIEPCLDVNDPFCVVLPNPGVFDPAFPMVLPDNFPDEFFYSVVDSDRKSTRLNSSHIQKYRMPSSA